ncbi:MAG TPA: GNAT family N-acetyltransferase [Pseudobdellovibrionaceae bacterium]|nr:GNAT family N-acetyltransferase [Pseudobdellovibrionaceae bacterium]
MDSSSFEVRKIPFEEIFPLWRNELWKDREDPIRPLSSMTLSGGYDMGIYRRFQPVFFGLFENGVLVGCNSCHPSSETEMRSRGLFIRESSRGKNGSRLLLKAAFEEARARGSLILWSYPRRASAGAYLSFGFVPTRDCEKSPSHQYVSMSVNPR